MICLEDGMLVILNLQHIKLKILKQVTYCTKKVNNDVHYHEHMTEINFLVNGKMILNDIELNKGDIFIIDKYEIACPIFLEDCYIFVLKVPSVPGDKIIL